MDFYYNLIQRNRFITPTPPPADLFIVDGELDHCNYINAKTTLTILEAGPRVQWDLPWLALNLQMDDIRMSVWLF